MIPVVMLGEKDHGKSTLLGRLLYETKTMPEDRIAEVKAIDKKIGKPFEWAHLLDSFLYERKNDMTLDATRVVIRLGKNLYEFIDVPGHQELIKNMLSGASEAQNAILVVSAEDGIKPQTINHLNIAKFLGINRILAIINKCDLNGFSEKKFLELKKSVAKLLSHIGFSQITILPVATYRGDNLTKRSRNFRWFKGPTLAESIGKIFRIREKNIFRGRFQMFVQDVYSGGLLIGKVAGGKIASGRYVKLYPGGNRHRVKKVFVGNSEITTASAGDNIGAILDPAPSIAERGCLLASRKPKYVSESAATCIFIEKPAGKLSLETGYKNIPAEIKIDKGKLPIGKPVKVRIKTKYPIYVDKFVIKHQDAIIGIGKI